jgi:hypothetical protein
MRNNVKVLDVNLRITQKQEEAGSLQAALLKT